ncbi:MAG: hypothetical protein AB7G39_03575 [Alphaproteobacteria bacterium]
MDAPHRLGDAVGVASRAARRRREALDALERSHDGPLPAVPEMSAAEWASVAVGMIDRMACRAVRALAAHRRRSRDPLRSPQLAVLARDLLECRASGLAAVQAARSSPASARSIRVTVSATP